MCEVSRVTFTAREAASYLGVSTWLVYELIKRKEINPIRAGGRYLFRQSGLDVWMDKQEQRVIEDEKNRIRRAK